MVAYATSIGARVSNFCSSNDAKMDGLAHGARKATEREITDKGLEYFQELRLCVAARVANIWDRLFKFYSCNVGEVASVVDFFQRRLEHHKLLCRCCSLMGLDLNL